jgi:hypothetical protein
MKVTINKTPNKTGLEKVAVQGSADQPRLMVKQIWFSASIPQMRNGENRHLRQTQELYRA